jgi:hypothetical protein
MTQLFTTEAFQKGHRNWALRPDDEGFDRIDPVIAKLQDRHARSRETEINLPRLAREGDIVATGSDEIRLIQPDGQEFEFTPWGFRALCKKVGAHTEFLKKLPAANVASDLKYLLRDTDARNSQIDDDGNWEDDQKVLLLGTEQKGLAKIRHLGSMRYGRIWDLQVAEWVKGIMERYGFSVPPTFDSRPRGLYVGDQDCFFFLGNDERTIEVQRPDGRTETMKRGLMVWNSEVGKRTFGLCTYLYQMICGNHIVWGAENVQTLQTRHVGNALERATEDLIPSVQGYLDSGTGTEIDMLTRAMHTRIAEERPEAVRILRTKGFTKGIATDAMVKAATDPTNAGLDPLSWMAAVNGLTLIARDMPNADARNALEQKASGLLPALVK